MVSHNSVITALIEKFKSLKTVAEWKTEAQDALKNKNFLIRFVTEDLHRIEREEAQNAPAQQRGMPMQQRSPFPGPQQQMGGYQPQSAMQGQYGARQPSPAAEPAKQTSLAELMNMVRRQQQQTQQ